MENKSILTGVGIGIGIGIGIEQATELSGSKDIECDGAFR